MLESDHESVVVLASDSFWVAHRRLDVRLQVSFEQLVHFAVVVLVMADAEKGMDVIPDGKTKRRRVDIGVVTHPALVNKS